MTTQLVSSRENAFVTAPFSSPRRFIDMVRLWRDRIRARRELAALSALDLKDIGFPSGVEAEKHKPFWRA